MKKIILVGRSESGKTTLIQALKGEKIHYHKTQYVNHFDVIIDTPGEYCETRNLGAALAMYTFEAHVVGLLLSATEPYSLFSPCCAVMANRPVIGIVTKTDHPDANPKRAEAWLKLAGCEKVFFTSSYNHDGIGEILEYLKEDGDVLPWEIDGKE
ncbi:MAG: EutP/PduV family microcompartment system protein [Clostridia bacterium]|nr:EutP/PduV family microcompartment system protein [Clostridia bacterium]